MRRRNRLAVVVDFDGAFASRTSDALRAVGAMPRIVLYEDLSPSYLAEVDPLAVVLAASDLGTSFPPRPELFSLDIPFLGICNGAQLIASALGGMIEPLSAAEEGPVEMQRVGFSPVLAGTPRRQVVSMYHEWSITRLPLTLKVRGQTERSPIAMFETVESTPLVGTQFHPESPHTTNGARLLRNFLRLAGAYRSTRRRWTLKA